MSESEATLRRAVHEWAEARWRVLQARPPTLEQYARLTVAESELARLAQ